MDRTLEKVDRRKETRVSNIPSITCITLAARLGQVREGNRWAIKNANAIPRLDTDSFGDNLAPLTDAQADGKDNTPPIPRFSNKHRMIARPGV